MKILALDTATLVASAAVLVDGAIASSGDARVSTHSEQLLPLLDDLLARAGVRPGELDAIACGAGPGSFTGLRIGLATAKGLCYALGKPLVLVSSLAALALEAAPAARHAKALVLATLDAKKREVYAGLYRVGDDGPRAVAPEVVLPPDRVGGYLVAAAGAPVVVVGDGATAYPVVAAGWGTVAEGMRGTPSAEAVAELAAGRLAAGDTDDLLTASPTYIRASEAEIATPGNPSGSVARPRSGK